MNNRVKILSALLVSVLGISYSSTNKVNEVKSDEKPLVVRNVLKENTVNDSGTIVSEVDAPAANNLVSDVLAQITSPKDGKVNIRFVAGIDSYTYDYAAFNITLKDASGTVVKEARSYQVNSAYLGIEVDGEAQYPSDICGEGYNYLIAYTLTDVPSDYWNYNFAVTASIGSDAKNVTTSTNVQTKNIASIVTPVETKELTLDSGVWNPHGGFFLQFGWTNEIVVKNLISYKAFGTMNGVEYPFAFNRNLGDNSKGLIFTTSAMLSSGIETATYTLKIELIDVNAIRWTTSVRVVNGSVVTLDTYKTSAVTELEAYLTANSLTENLYTEENWGLINSYIESGKTNINAAESYDAVDAALATAKTNINAVEQKDLSADEAIANAKTLLSNYVTSLTEANYSEENWNTIQELLAAGNVALEACETEEEVNTTLESYKTQIGAVKMLPKELVLDGCTWNPHGNVYLQLGWSSDVTNSNITSCSAIGIVNGVEYPFAFNRNNGDKEKIFTNDKMVAVTGDIAKATYTLVLSFIDANGVEWTATVEVVDGQKLTLSVAKTKNIERLNSYLEEKGYKQALYSEENWNTIQSLIATGTTNINAATTIDDANSALNATLEAIDAVEQLKVTYASVEFYHGDSLVKTVSYVVGETVGEFPSIPGYDVIGWFTTSTFDEESKVTENSVVSADMKLYAQTEVSALPTFDVMLNSAVNGAWIYCSITWEDGYALKDENIEVGNFVLSNGNTLNYTGRVGVASITGNTIKLGLGFADASFMNQNVTLRLTVTTGGVTYYIDVAAYANTGSGVDYDMTSVVTSFA